MTHTQATNLLTFNTLILNEKILIPDYIIEKFNLLIGKVDDVVIREYIDEDQLNIFLFSIDYFASRGGYTEENLSLFGYRNSCLSIDYHQSILLSTKEKMIIFYLKSFSTYEDIFSNYDKYIGDLSLINDKEVNHIHPILKEHVKKDIKEHIRIINLYKVLY
jgi:hypothetical protein